jgi:hypothetical protein
MSDVALIIARFGINTWSYNYTAPETVKMAETGEMLTAMVETGERHSGRNPQNLPNVRVSHGATPDPTLAELGFSRSRASRWALAGEIDDAALDECERQTGGKPLHGEGVSKPTLTQLGFSSARASRWR